MNRWNRHHIVRAAFAASALVFGCTGAYAQNQEQFIPVLSFRTGPYAANGAPLANGFIDYIKLVNERGGIDGVKLTFEECEMAYDTARAVECYERLRGKNGGAAFVNPLSTGATFAITEKASYDKIPLVTFGYGRSDSADGMAFKWNFPIGGTYWVAADAILNVIATKEGGWDKLKGKKIALVHLDVPYGKEPIPLLQERSRMHGFEFTAVPVAAPGVEQRAPWLQVRQMRADYVLLWGFGVMNTTALKEAQATGFPREKLYGSWWSGAEPDVRDIGQGAKGYNAVTIQHGAAPDAKVTQAILSSVHGNGKGTGPKSEVGEVLYMRGVISAFLGIEGIKAAQERFGKGKVMTGEQVRWGLENLKLTQAKLDALGFEGVLHPISTSCADHTGAAFLRIHSWDGSNWKFTSDWVNADMQVVNPIVRASSAKYMEEKKLPPRPSSDCQP